MKKTWIIIASAIILVALIIIIAFGINSNGKKTPHTSSGMTQDEELISMWSELINQNQGTANGESGKQGSSDSSGLTLSLQTESVDENEWSEWIE